MWQGVGTCGCSGGTVMGHVTGGRVWGQAYNLDGDKCHGVGPCCRVSEHVARYGGMWQGVVSCGRR